jgi:hypothetical protein
MIWLALIRPDSSVRDLLSPEALSVAEQRGLTGRITDMRLVDVVGLGAAGAMAIDANPVIEVARDERMRRVLLERTFARKPERCTLEDLGQEFGLSRERVRQLERRAEQALEGFLNQLGTVSTLISSVLGARIQAERLATTLPVLTGLDPSSVPGRIALAALSLAAYPSEAGGTLFSFDLDRVVEHLSERASRNNPYHLLDEDLVEEARGLLGPSI